MNLTWGRTCGPLLVAATLLLTGPLGACSSPSGVSTHKPVAEQTTDPRLPAGWARFSYGALSVGAPANWKVSSAPLFCGSPPSTVTETTSDSLRATSCPSFGPDSPRVQAVAIECLRGGANGLFRDSGPGTSMAGGVLHTYGGGTAVYLQGSRWEGVVLLPMNFGPASLGNQILGTVEPTGRPC